MASSVSWMDVLTETKDTAPPPTAVPTSPKASKPKKARKDSGGIFSCLSPQDRHVDEDSDEEKVPDRQFGIEDRKPEPVAPLAPAPVIVADPPAPGSSSSPRAEVMAQSHAPGPVTSPPPTLPDGHSSSVDGGAVQQQNGERALGQVQPGEAAHDGVHIDQDQQFQHHQQQYQEGHQVDEQSASASSSSSSSDS